MSDVTPQNTPHMTITNFNYKGSYLPGVICNIVVKVDLGRSPGRSTPQKCANWSEWQFQMFTIRAHIGRSPGRSTPQLIQHRCLECQYTKLGRQTYFGRWTPPGNWAEMPWILVHPTWQTNLLWPIDPPHPESRIDVLNTATPNLADEPTLADGPPTWNCQWWTINW